MQEPYREGVANRSGLEPCAVARKGKGRSVGRGTCGPSIEPRNTTGLGCRRCQGKRKATSQASLARDACEPCAVGDLVHARKLLARNPGGPVAGRRDRLRSAL